MKTMRLLLPFSLLAVAPAAPAQQVAAPTAAPRASVAPPADTAQPTPAVRFETATVVARHPHDPAAFTQGLLWHDGKLFESTGHESESEIRRVDLTSGKVEARATLPADQFGEGLALAGDQLVSLTWTSGIAHRWDVDTLRHRGTATYPGEGWGLASDGETLVLSDGSDELRFLDPATLAERRRVSVTIDGRALPQINELEVIDGLVWANIWFSGFIVAIDPATGHVVRAVDLRPLVREVGLTDRDAVLNGIAWDREGRRLFVTGKYWPTLFEIRIDSATPPPAAQ